MILYTINIINNLCRIGPPIPFTAHREKLFFKGFLLFLPDKFVYFDVIWTPLFPLHTGWHKKTNFWKTLQKLKKSKKKQLLTEIDPLQLAF